MEEAFNEAPEDGAEGDEKEPPAEGDEDLEDDSDDDDINVVIGDIKSGPSYNIKQRGQAMSGAPNAAGKQPTGKFNIEEFEQVGTISGVPAHEFSIDSLEEKPWRKPGADITDYFNYGFNEDTWRAYCERQKRFRVQESGVGLATLSVLHSNQPMPQNGMGPPMKRPFYPARKGIDVIGGGAPLNRPMINDMSGPPKGLQTKENIIQVMTADRREYSRLNRSFGMEDGPMIGEPFYEEPFDYMNSYEPTQDSQWQGNPGWGPGGGVKELTPVNAMNMPPPGMGPPGMGQMPPFPPAPMNPMGMPPGGPPPMLNMPPHMNVQSQNSPRGNFDKDRGRIDRGGRGESSRRNLRSRSRSRERSRRPRSRSRERSRRPRSRSRERSHRPRSRSRESKRRSKSRSRDRDRRSKSRDRKKDEKREKDRDKDKDTKDKDKSDKEHKKDKKKSHKKDKADD